MLKIKRNQDSLKVLGEGGASKEEVLALLTALDGSDPAQLGNPNP